MKASRILIIISIILAAFVCGCTKTIYTPIESHTRDSVTTKAELSESQFHYLVNALQRQVNIRDSIVIRDSVIMVVNETGDVISKEVFHDRDRNSSRDELITQIQAKYDSIFNAQREEVNAILEQLNQVPVPVEKKLSKWQQFKQDVGGITIGILIVVVIIAVVWLIKKFRLK